ncbi:hypothetical protein BDV34DRAFT_215656 [Aspergillus parasiticus]|uniref:Uncharacterized protein n=1 Tax=Aspergillus parasiticus TaxID=5067 RepID=A0A5N6DB55_ASPPA|nr:hypothetical protein BDV34DRAFT_215656 [Aspergillus parasiticus]
MKFSTILVATTALLTGANAVPRLVEVHSTDVCWRVCFPEKPHCPEGWHDKKFGVSSILHQDWSSVRVNQCPVLVLLVL